MSPVFVNGNEISEKAINQEIQYHPAEDFDYARKKATQALVIKAVLEQEAKNIVTEAELKQQAGSGETAEEARIRLLLEKAVSPPKVDEQTCHRYFQQNRQKFTTDALVEVSHILLAADPKDVNQRRESKALARSLIKELKSKPEKFKSLAKEYSSCPSKEVGGSLGQLSHNQTVPEFERQVFKLKKGLAEYPIESRYGFHITLVDARVEGRPLEFEQVKDKITEYLKFRAERQAVNDYLHRLLDEAKIEGLDFEISGSPYA